MTYYILKNKNNEYFYNLKNFLDSPEFGVFNLSSMTLFNTEIEASTCKSNLENILDESIVIEKISVTITSI